MTKNKEMKKNPQHFMDKVEKEIYGEERFLLRKTASEAFSAAMKLVSAHTEKVYRATGLDRKLLCFNLRRYAEMAPKSFWDVVEEEVKKVGVVGLEDLYVLSPLNRAMFEELKRKKNAAQKASMLMSQPLSIAVTKCFYLIEEEKQDSEEFKKAFAFLTEYTIELEEEEDGKPELVGIDGEE